MTQHRIDAYYEATLEKSKEKDPRALIQLGDLMQASVTESKPEMVDLSPLVTFQLDENAEIETEIIPVPTGIDRNATLGYELIEEGIALAEQQDPNPLTPLDYYRIYKMYNNDSKKHSPEEPGEPVLERLHSIQKKRFYLHKTKELIDAGQEAERIDLDNLNVLIATVEQEYVAIEKMEKAQAIIRKLEATKKATSTE